MGWHLQYLAVPLGIHSEVLEGSEARLALFLVLWGSFRPPVTSHLAMTEEQMNKRIYFL